MVLLAYDQFLIKKSIYYVACVHKYAKDAAFLNKSGSDFVNDAKLYKE